jgi:hypothetical protein
VQQNTHLVGTRDTTKWTDVRNIKWTKINMVTHVIRVQPFYILGEGVVLNLTGCHRFSFSNHQQSILSFVRVELKKNPTLSNTSSHNVYIDRISDVSISLTENQKLALVCRKPYYSTTCISRVTKRWSTLYCNKFVSYVPKFGCSLSFPSLL